MTLKSTLTSLLFVFALFPTFLSAQVGVNNPDPEQALDVAGKVKISDDAATPTDGTIRYNETDGTFEGFTNGEWEVLNKSVMADRPIPVTLAMFNTQPSSTWEDMDLVDTHGNGFTFGLNSDNQRRAVPAGYLLVIDMIEVMGMNRDSDEQFRVNIAGSRANETPAGGRVNPQVYVSGSCKGGNVTLGTGRAPIIVLQAGEQLVFVNDSSSSNTDGVRMLATGFLVQDLDQYFSY